MPQSKSDKLKISRNLQLCHGAKSCGLCIDYLPPLQDGQVTMSRMEYTNNVDMAEMAVSCPAGAIEVTYCDKN